MLRVVIADDEARICKLIQILADWAQLGMEVVGVASNGPDAVALVHEHHADILITDIRMPGCDGLSVIREAKARLPELEVIIISGYAQFDYARTAIQYGVGEYLLKPINREGLNSTLARMGESCRARKASALDMEAFRTSAREDINRLRENLVSDLLDGRYMAKDAASLAQTYHFSGQGDVYQAFLLKLDYDLDLFSGHSLDIVCEKITDTLSPMLAELCGDYVLACRQSAVYGVVNYDGEKQGTLRTRLRDCLNLLVARQDLFGSVVFSMALSPAGDSPAALPDAFRNIHAIIAERLVEGTGRLLEGETGAAVETDLLARYTQDITRAIDVLSEEDADWAVAALERGIMEIRPLHGRELLALARDAGLLFITQIGGDARGELLQAYERQCGQCFTAGALFDCLRALQGSLIASAKERRQSLDGQPIRLAKQYIQKHFADPLTLEEVSAAIGFSVTYFSHLFKKETGEGFAKYLMRLRMDEAKGLLRETRLPVQEICKRVGYGDIKHFTRTFRAETGLTPGEYRKLYG